MAEGKKHRKFGRNADYCKTYTAAGLDEKNRKRRMRRHLLDNPDDTQAAKEFERTFGPVADLRIVENKKSTERTISARARRHQSRNNDQLLQARLRASKDARRHSRRVMREKLIEQDKQQRSQQPVQVHHEAVSTATR